MREKETTPKELADDIICLLQFLCRNKGNPCSCDMCSQECPADAHPGCCAGDAFFQPEEYIRTETKIRRRLLHEFLWFRKNFGKLPPCLSHFSGPEELLRFLKDHEEFLDGAFRLRSHFYKLPLPKKEGEVEWEKHDYLSASMSHAERTFVEELLRNWKQTKTKEN